MRLAASVLCASWFKPSRQAAKKQKFARKADNASRSAQTVRRDPYDSPHRWNGLAPSEEMRRRSSLVDAV
jgi:hypothetical protein